MSCIDIFVIGQDSWELSQMLGRGGRDGNNAAFVIMLWTDSDQAGSLLLDFDIVFHLLFLFDQVAVVLARHWAEFSWSKEWNTSGAKGRPSMIFSKWRIHTVSDLKPTYIK